MKKIFFCLTLSLFAGGYFYTQHYNLSQKMTPVMLENIEALAGNEGDPNSRTCFQYWRKAPNDGSLAYWDCICNECEFYWLLEGRYRSTRAK